MSIVTVGLEYFPDPKVGRPVAFGSIYVGKIDTDPFVEANRLQMYIRQEDGVEIAVTQPILTGAGGIPMYGGSPCQILVQGDYALLVNDESGEQAYYIPDSSKISDPFESSELKTEVINLIPGEVSYLVTLPVDYSSVYINGQGVDRGRLAVDIDYTADSVDSRIILFDSYPEGSTMTLTFNDVGGSPT